MKKIISLLLVLALALSLASVTALAADAPAAPAVTVKAGSTEVQPASASQEQYYSSYFKDYNWYGPSSKPVNGETANKEKTTVYTYAVPADTESVTLAFGEDVSVYAYEKKAEGELEKWIAGYWTGASKTYAVTMGDASASDDKTKTMTIDKSAYSLSTLCLYVQNAKDGSLLYILEFTGPAAPAVKTSFSDVAEGSWYFASVQSAAKKNILKGTSATTFSPELTMTRAMLVTALWNLAGKPAAKAAASFSDVKDGSWYAAAAAWAAENKLVLGANGAFSPETPVTREQLAAILYRYAVLKGFDVSIGEETNILSYDDAFTISEYAIPAIQWACGAGLMNGSGRNLLPKSGATRAQVAAILVRFADAYVK